MKTTQNTNTQTADASASATKEIKNVIKLIQATDKSKVILSKFIQHDIEENKGQIILLTAQHLCTKTPANSFKNCTTLNSLSRAVKRITSDEANDMDAVNWLVNNLTDKESQHLIQALGKIIS